MKDGEYKLALNNYFSEDDINETKYDEEAVKSVLKSDLNGVFGLPYQFLPNVDPRISGTDIGKIYAEKIISKIPLLFLTPCRQEFMPDFSGQDREVALANLLGELKDQFTGNLSTTGKYYTTKFAYDEYIKYVNTMATQLSYFLGIGNNYININGKRKKIKNIDWNLIKNDGFKNYFSASNAVVYYLDGLTSMTESFTNTSTESSLASTINGFSDQANEIKFLLGEDSALGNLMNGATEVGDGILSVLSGTISNLAGGMLSDLASTGVSTVLTGGKIIFPKIWQDSGFNRSYSFDIKLRSPDHDSTSIFLNILIPYIHILAMTLPIGKDNDPNAYTSPFLVKAYCKGMFNIDMGLITDLTVTRGAECQWNDDGLPTQIDISITIEDLYSSLFMTDESDSNLAIVKNTSMMDFLANLAGLNIAETEILRRERMLLYLTGSDLTRIPSSIYNKFDTAIANIISKIDR